MDPMLVYTGDTPQERQGIPVRLWWDLARKLATINDLAGPCGVAYPTAARAEDSLEQLGIVREITGRSRDRAFAHDRYVVILNEGTEPL